MSQGLPLKYCRNIRLDPTGSWALCASTPMIALEPGSLDTYDGHQALINKLDAKDTQWKDATLLLDQILGNNNGTFAWNGNPNQPRRDQSLSGTRLTAQLRATNGEWLASSVDLNDHLDGMNGVISFTDVPRIELGENEHIKVDYIKIKPLYPILDEFGQAPGFETPLTLWSPGKTDANPCTVDMNGDETEITVRLTLKQEDITISGYETSLPLDSDTTVVDSKTRLVHFRIRSNKSPGYIMPIPNGVPWGHNGRHLWVFKYTVGKDNKPHTLSLPHPIEIYGVTRYATDYRTKPAHDYGIPRAALDFYLIHAKNVSPEPINNLNDYVRSIVYAVHWCSGFVYDTFGGSSSFTQILLRDGWSFNVRLWAYLLRPTTKDDRSIPDGSHRVNCYDQAAAVWTGVTLALGAGDVPKLIWRFAEPFGFIRSTHLVGWHDATNNPFFHQYTGAQYIPDTDGRFTGRTSFGNHAFLEFDGKVLDATCGPCVGDDTLDQYLKRSIDDETGRRDALVNADGNASGARKILAEYQSNLNSILNHGSMTADYLYRDQPGDRERCEQAIERQHRVVEQIEKTGSATSDYIVRLPGEPSFTGTKGVVDLGSTSKSPINMDSAWKTLRPLEISPLGWTHQKNARVQVDEAALTQEQNSERANRFISASSLQNVAEDIQKKFKIPFSDHDMRPELRIIDFSPTYCHFSWKACASTGASASALSVDIYMLLDYDEATSWFAMRANPPTSTVSKVPLFKRTDGANGGRRSLAGVIAGRGNVLHAVGNIVFEAHGFDRNEALKPFEDYFFNTLLSSQKSGPEEGLGQLNVHCTNAKEEKGPGGVPQITVKQGEKLQFTAEAKNGFGLRCNLENYWVMVPLQLNPEVSKDSVPFEFLARNSGTETLEFVACDKWLDIIGMRRVTYKIVVQD